MSGPDRPPGTPDEATWTALEALAAGEQPAAEAEAWNRRLAEEPALAAAYAEVTRIEHLLRAEPMLPVPLGLVARVAAEVAPARAPRPLQALARVAAAVLVFFAAWLAFAEETPAVADIRPGPALVDALPGLDPSGAVSQEARALLDTATPAELAASARGGFLLIGAGIVLLALGLAIALRWHRLAGAGEGT